MGSTGLEDVHILGDEITPDGVNVSAMLFEAVNGAGSATVEHVNLVRPEASLVEEKRIPKYLGKA